MCQGLLCFFVNRPLNRENTSNGVDRGGLAKEVLWLMVTCGGVSSESMETPARKLLNSYYQ